MERYEALTQSPEKLIDELLQPHPEVVVITGGPCAGKSTLLTELHDTLQQQEKPYVIIPEVATAMAERGVNFAELATTDRQAYIELEKAIIQTYAQKIADAKESLAGTDGLILVDRGPKDVFAYLEPLEGFRVARELGGNPSEVGYRDVDKVIYLPSLATSSPDRYEELKTTNAARYENAHGAAATDTNTLYMWSKFPELHLVDHPDFATKMLMAGNFCLSGEAEYEQKWSIDDFTAREWMAKATCEGRMLCGMRFTQTYHQLGDVEFRLRKGNASDEYEFYHFAIKEKTPTGNREIRRSLTRQQYEQLAQVPGKGFTKNRYIIREGSQLWQLDLLWDRDDQPFWIVETETHSAEALQNLELPQLAGPMTPSDFNTKKFALAS